MIATAKRYLVTTLGGCAIAGFVAYGIFFVGKTTVASLVETTMQDRGASFAEFLLGNDGAADALLTGVARDPDSEQRVRNVAGLSSIESFGLFDRSGQEVYRSRSERYKWLLRDRPGGVTTGDRLSDSVLAKTGDWRIVTDDGQGTPSVLLPLIRDGQSIGYLSVASDFSLDRASYKQVVMAASLRLLVIIGLATGLPALIYLRRQRRMAEATERIHFLANHDPLTRLMNRTKLQEEIERLLATSRATREHMAFHFVDVKGLSEINNVHGQAQGDTLLRVIAERLSKIVEPTDLLGRLGADDFAILQRKVYGGDDVGTLARRIHVAVAEPIDIGGASVCANVSIGVAMMPTDGRTYSELVKHSELALFCHKTTGTGDCVLFEPYMDEESHRRRTIEAMIAQSIENDGFELFYQPILQPDGARLIGFEALIRMRDGKGGYIPPSDFIPIAEARGQIKAIGNWVIRHAAAQAAQWPAHLVVSINLSPVQFRDGDLVETVRSAIEAAGIPGSRLEMEVVESLLLDHTGNILDQLKGLKALGASVAMDDFGTGYSSLGYLWRFPFDKLKIDQSFMRALAAGEANVAEIVATIISLGHHLHLTVTAEGVETQEEADLLAALDCDQIQGYHYGRPMPVKTIDAEFLPLYGRDGQRTRTHRAPPRAALDAVA